MRPLARGLIYSGLGFFVGGLFQVGDKESFGGGFEPIERFTDEAA